MDLKDVSAFAAQLGAGATVLLLFAVIAFATEKVVSGTTYRRHVEECRQARERYETTLAQYERFADAILTLGEEGAALLPRARRRNG